MIKEMQGKNETRHPPCGKGKFGDVHILQSESLVFPSLSGQTLTAFELQNRGCGK